MGIQGIIHPLKSIGFRTDAFVFGCEDRHGGLSLQVVLSFIMLPKWHGRDNPPVGVLYSNRHGAAIIWTGTGACPYINPFQTVL